ncbi:MAG: hypothetical protein WC790_01745 [Candidatus Paceibacterota bacterium]|jgi:hypothetical protein
MTSDNKLLYGLNNCLDLYAKLKYEGENLESNWNEYNSFNFIVTSWHLYNDWLKADSVNRPRLSTKKKEPPKTPPNMLLVVYALRDIANSSKHFFLNDDALNK